MAGQIQNPWRFICKGIVYRFIIGWCILVPLALLIPKKKGLILHISRKGESFANNTKYFFLYLHHIKAENTYFLTENEEIYSMLSSKQLPAVYFPTLKGIYMFLRAAIVVVDSNEWIGNFKPHLAYKAKKVQLWHGVGMKKVGNLNPKYVQKKESLLFRMYHKVILLNMHYDVVVLSSDIQVQYRAKMFKYDQILINGQPRNDILLGESYGESIYLGTDISCIKRVKQLKEEGYKIILYTPTWRKEATLKNHDHIIDFKRFADLAKENKLIMVIKEHTKSRMKFNGDESKYILKYNSNEDVYPLFELSDVMITDYSSIYIDYLLLNKPVIFYPYDYEEYRDEQRLHYAYEEVVVGPICYTQEELYECLLSLLHKGLRVEEQYKQKRQEMLDWAYLYIDSSSSRRTFDYIRDNFY